MKYYKLENETLNNNITGVQFQSTEGFFGDIQQNYIPFDGEINFDFLLPEPKLKTRAKRTDLLSVTFIPPWFLVISDRLLEIFKSKSFTTQFWKIKVIQGGEILSNYNIFYIPNSSQCEIIDFSKSIFSIKKFGNLDSLHTNISFTNFDNYSILKNKLINTNQFLKADKLFLDFSSKKCPLLRLINIEFGGYFISEEFKKCLENENITGIRFKKIEELNKFIETKY